MHNEEKSCEGSHPNKNTKEGSQSRPNIHSVFKKPISNRALSDTQINISEDQTRQDPIGAASDQSVPQNDAKAVERVEKLAAQGDATAQNNLGWMYQHGQGVPQNFAKALEWYEKSAAQGHKTACDLLNILRANESKEPTHLRSRF